MGQETSKPEGAEVTPQPEVKTSNSIGGIFDDAYLQRRMEEAKTKEGQSAEDKSGEETPATEVDKPAEEPGEDDSLGGLLEEIELKDGKKVPVMDLVKDSQFVIPVGDKEHTVGFDDLLKFAGMGINSSERNRTAKEAVRIANETITEMEKSLTQKVDALANSKLDEVFQLIQKGIDPSSGKPFANAEDKGAAEFVVDKARNALRTTTEEKPTQPGLTKEDIEKLLNDRENKRTEAERQAQNTRKAQDMLEKAVAPLTQKFLKADGKTVSPRILNNFKTDVLNEAVRLGKLAGGSLNEAQAQAVLSKAIKSVLPDYEEFSGGRKITSTVPKGTPIPTLKSSGGGTAVQTNAPKNFRTQEEAWAARLK